MSPKFGIIYSRLHRVIAPAAFSNRVEAMGFDSVWATEGLANQLPALDPLIAMGALAQGSERITVGSCVVLLPLRNPVVLAKEIASLDVLYGGRIILGIGAGASALSPSADFRAVGVDPRERGARCDEYLAIMTQLWSGQSGSFHGRFHRFDDIAIRPTPQQQPHPPIWAGGNASGMLKRAARWCDGFVPMGEGAMAYRESWERVRHHAEGMGRDPATITRAVHLYYCLGKSRGEAHARVERTLSERYGMPVSLIDDGRYSTGTPDDCARAIESYLAAGVEHIVINTVRALAEVPAEIERFAADIMPRFR